MLSILNGILTIQMFLESILIDRLSGGITSMLHIFSSNRILQLVPFTLLYNILNPSMVLSLGDF